MEGAASGLEPTPRARALGLLVARSPSPAGGPWGPRALWDPSPWVQRAGVLALGQRLPETESAALLEGFVARGDVDPYVRSKAAMLLGTDAAATLVSAAWRSEHEAWRVAPLALAAAVLGDPDAVGALGDALAAGEIGLEVDFLRDVGQSGLTDLLPALRASAAHVEEELALPVAAAQLALGDAAGEQALRKALADPDEELRLEALDYVSRLDHEAAEALLRKARAHGPDLVRWYADLALASRHGDALELLDTAILEADPEIRALAVRFAAEAYARALGSKRTAKGVRKVLHHALGDPDPSVRVAALRAMSELGLDGEDALVDANLRHGQEAVRIEAAGVRMGGGLDRE